MGPSPALGALVNQAVSSPHSTRYRYCVAGSSGRNTTRCSLTGWPSSIVRWSGSRGLYQKLDLDAALAELQLAEVDAKDSQDQMVQVLIYRGLIYSETGKLSDASDQFKRALAMQPWAEVPSDTSPRIAKNFSDARRAL